MKTKSSRSARTSNACGMYRASCDVDCEVTPLLLVDRDCAKWMSNHKLSGNEVHHILGRGKKPEYDFGCNLILVSKAAHAWGHDVAPHKLELACLAAKWQLHQRLLDKAIRDRLAISEYVGHWNPSAMNEICAPQKLLSGRIAYLAGSVEGTVFESYAAELTAVLIGEAK